MEKRKDTLRNKKCAGRGMRTGLRHHTHANTTQLRRILNYLEMKEKDCMTGISRNTGILGAYVKDALLFLLGLKLIKKFNPSSKVSRAYYYKLNLSSKRS